MTCSTITGNQCYSEDLSQGRLEVPGICTFKGESKLIGKIRKLLKVPEA